MIEGLNDIFIELPALCEKPEPMDTFINYLDYKTAFYKTRKKDDLEEFSSVEIKNTDYYITQEDWCFQGQRVAQKDGLSIAYLIVNRFVDDKQFKKKYPQGVKGLGHTEREQLRKKVDPRGEWMK